MQRLSRGLFGGLLLATTVTLSGCDYWPPALQAQIEQLRQEVQTVSGEKAQLQTQLTDLAKAKEDLQIQVDTLTRANQERANLIASLQTQVDDLREKAAKLMAPKAAPKPAAKAPAAKTSSKPAAKKKTTGK